MRFDLALLQGTSGDKAAQDNEWLQVFRHFNPRLNSFFADRCGDWFPVDELLTDLWSRACLHIRSVRSAEALWSWLTTIGNNLLTDKRRYTKRSREILFTDIGTAEGKVEEFIAGWIQPVTSAVEHSVLNTLPDEDRELLALYAIDGLSHDEIAGRLGLPSAAASRQRLRRLRLRLINRTDD
jgi:RNA polymerase sigma factor (sigma-70 family)